MITREGCKTYGDVDERYAGSKVRVRLDFVDESVLAPVACHESQAHQSKRYQEHKYCRASVHVRAQEVQESIVAKFACSCLSRERRLSCPEKITRKIKPDEEVKAANIAHKVSKIVPLIANCRR
jgi:hypothetical protein